MSAMDLLPNHVRADIAKGSGRLRSDLLVIPEAEAAGWAVSFRNDHWHNGASFVRGDVTVWGTGRDWRRRAGLALDENHKFRAPEVFPDSIEGLRAALTPV